MNAGLPTTGIGGIFYFFSVIIMLLLELFLTLRGKSSRVRWIFVGKQVILVSGILLALFITGWLLSYFIPVRSYAEMLGYESGSSVYDTPRLIYASPFLLLIFLFISVQLISLVLKMKVAFLRFR